jgi:hypothetical protein
MEIQEVPEFEGERCRYSIIVNDPSSSTGQGLRDAALRGDEQARKCISCNGEREDCARLECWIYNAESQDKTDGITRKKGTGFLLVSRLCRIPERKEKEWLKIEVRESKELREIPARVYSAEGGETGILELEEMFGDE